MSRAPNNTVAAVRQSLAAYQTVSAYPLPLSSKDRFISSRLRKLHKSSRPSERSHLSLQLADHCFERLEDYQLALIFYSHTLSNTLSVSSFDIAHVMTLVRRVGECHYFLSHYPQAISAFNSSLSLLPFLPPNTSKRERLWLMQTLHLSLGNAYLNWGDDEHIPLSVGYERVNEATRWHRLSVKGARDLCELKRGRMSGLDALLLIGANMNLGNAIVQQIHFDNYEMRARQRTELSSSTLLTPLIISPPLIISSVTSSSISSNVIDPLDTPLDSSLSTLSSSTLLDHRQLRFLGAKLAYETALDTAVGHNKVKEQADLWNDLATLYDAMEDYQQSNECYKKAEEAEGGEGWEWRVKAMQMWMRGERWMEALQEAQQLRKRIEKAEIEGTVNEEERKTAMADVQWVEGLWAKVQKRKQMTEEFEHHQSQSRKPKSEPSDASSQSNTTVIEVEEKEPREDCEQMEEEEERSLSDQVARLHSLVRTCLALVSAKVGINVNYPSALAAHQMAISLISNSSSRVFPRLSLSVHSFHVNTIVRYLPWLVRMKRNSGELDEIVQRGELSIRAAKEALKAGGAGKSGEEEEVRARGLLAWLDGQLQLQCGSSAKEVMATLQTGLSGPRREDSSSVIREWILVQMEHMIDVISGEKKQAEEAAMETDGDAVILQEERAEVEAALRQARRWRVTHPNEAAEEKKFLQSDLWLLTQEGNGEDGEEVEVIEAADSAVIGDIQSSQEKNIQEEDEEEVKEEFLVSASDEDEDFQEPIATSARSSTSSSSRTARRDTKSPRSPRPPLTDSLPPVSPVQYDMDDEDENDASLAQRTAEIISKRTRASSKPDLRRTSQPRRKRKNDDDWIIEDREEGSQSRGKKKQQVPRSSPSPHSAPSRRSARPRESQQTLFTRHTILQMRRERLKSAIEVQMEEEEQKYSVVDDRWRSSSSSVNAVRKSRSLSLEGNDNDSDTTVALEESRYPPCSAGQHARPHSMPLNIIDGGAMRADCMPPPVPARHSICLRVDSSCYIFSLSPLVPSASDPLRLSDWELDRISMQTLTTSLISHLHAQTGRECVVHQWMMRGEILPVDLTALYLFREVGQDIPAVVAVVDHWEPVSMAECYRKLCQSHSPPLPRHPLIDRQLQLHGMDPRISFPNLPPSSLTSNCLLPLFLAFRVEPASLTSLSLPRICIDWESIVCLVDVICCTQGGNASTAIRSAYQHCFPDVILSHPRPLLSSVNLLTPLSRLSILDVSHTLLSSASLLHLLYALPMLSALNSVNLSYTACNDSCLSALTFLVRYSPALNHLSLHSTQLTGGAQHLPLFASALSSSSTLTSLDIGRCCWTEQSLTTLLPSLTKLTNLCLSHTSPSPSSLRTFLAILARSDNAMQSLQLDGVRALQEMSVWCDVLYFLRRGGRSVGVAGEKVTGGMTEISLKGCGLDECRIELVGALHRRGDFGTLRLLV